MERLRRGSSATYLLRGPKTKLPPDFKSFLLNAENKKQFINFLLSQWRTDKYAQRLQGRQIFFVTEGECMCLESHDGLKINCRHVPSLFSSQEEADTRIILHCLYASQSAEADTNIIVRTPDTDVLVILSYSDCIAQSLFMYTGAGNQRCLINIHIIAEAIGLVLAQ